MAERVVHGCASCIHFHTEGPIVSGEMLIYRCSKSHSGRVPGWCPVGTLPKNMGCSYYNKLHPGDKIAMKSYFSNNMAKYMYCGKVGNKYLLYRPGNRGLIEVEKDYFRGQTGRIISRVIGIIQNDEQLEASRRFAKKKKQRWLEEYG